MFNYNYNPKTKQLFIELPSKLKFDYAFLKKTTDFIQRVSSVECEGLVVSCKEDAEYDKLSKAYLFNILQFFSAIKDTKWNKYLSELITSTVHSIDGKRFSDIEDIAKVVLNENLSFYKFKGDSDIEKPVDEMTRLLVDKNVVINAPEMKEFLSTTIGEIFSNSINHSDQDIVYFMFDIVFEKDDFYLWVNILDYGTTIVENVKNFLKAKKGIKDSEVVEETLDGIFIGTSVTFKVKLYETSQIIKYDTSSDELISTSLDRI